jgi:hypothetical protein
MRSNYTLSGKKIESKEPTAYSLAILSALNNNQNKDRQLMFQGTTKEKEVAARRRKTRAAKVTRRNRRTRCYEKSRY